MLVWTLTANLESRCLIVMSFDRGDGEWDDGFGTLVGPRFAHRRGGVLFLIVRYVVQLSWCGTEK